MWQGIPVACGLVYFASRRAVSDENYSFSGGSGAGGSMMAAASQSAKASTGWWARPVAAAVASLVAARMEA